MLGDSESAVAAGRRHRRRPQRERDGDRQRVYVDRVVVRVLDYGGFDVRPRQRAGIVHGGCKHRSTRTGRVTVGTQSIEVQQAASPSPSLCPESVTPSTASVRAAGGDVSFWVNAAGDSKWIVSNVHPGSRS